MPDEIIEELWAIKDAMAAEFGYDVKVLAVHLARKRQEAEQPVDHRASAQSEAGSNGQPYPAHVATVDPA
jgi:hypothetical protein